MNRQIVQQLVKSFREKFTKDPLLSQAPGRVNIIGEHTDYNEGFVLPAAIDKAIYVAVSKRDDEQIQLISLDFQDNFETTVQPFQPVEKQWVNESSATFALKNRRECKAVADILLTLRAPLNRPHEEFARCTSHRFQTI